MAIDPNRVKSILALPLPTNKKSLQSFLGQINFVRKFISDFAQKIRPISDKEECRFQVDRSEKGGF